MEVVTAVPQESAHVSTEQFSEHFQLGKTQAELDFVDVPIDGDIPLFIDPFAISQREDRWSQDCYHTILSFFERAITAIRAGDSDTARELFSHLSEPNETRFGFSEGRPRGAGIGPNQAGRLLTALSESSAVQTGFLRSLEEAELMVRNIGRDKISDLTTNVIRGHLASYTKDQCELHKVPTQAVPLGPYYSLARVHWISDYFDLPVANDQPVLLVPKVIARFDPAYEHSKYYQSFVLSFLQAEHLAANSSLVRTLKNGNKVVYKKDIEAIFPGTKENIFQFSRDHPEVLEQYREQLEQLELTKKSSVVDQEDDTLIAEALSTALASIPTGNDHASEYHQMMIGILEFIFFPNPVFPRKEHEIHQGRKRIDIVMENGARTGIFALLHEVRGLPCAFAAIECKNFGREVGNPEIDQLAGRFSPNRGKLGILSCRSFDDRARFIERCRDTLRDDRGLIVALDDATVKEWLSLITDGQGRRLDAKMTQLVDEVWLN
jgi:hypothetical protein